jgi:hypothetical protein
MRERSLSIPELMLFAGTRVALGIGIGMLLSGRFNRDVRKGAGWALVTVGALTTIPILAGVAHRQPKLDDHTLIPAAA